MKKLAKLTTTFGLLSTLLAVTPALAQTPAAPTIPTTQPNQTYNVQRQTGTCPSSISLWTSFRYYEGGGEHLVIANTAPIAGPAKLVSSGKKFAEFTAPLQRAYTSCVGQANPPDDDFPYRFRFSNGNLIFRVQLPPDTPSTPSEISYSNIVSSRPAVRWAIAD